VVLNQLDQYLAGNLERDRHKREHVTFYQPDNHVKRTSPYHFRGILKLLAKVSQPILFLEMHEFPKEYFGPSTEFRADPFDVDSLGYDTHEREKAIKALRKLGETLTQLRITMRNILHDYATPYLTNALVDVIGDMHKLRLIHICDGNDEPVTSFTRLFQKYDFPHLEELILDVQIDDFDKLKTFIWKHEKLENLSFSLNYESPKIQLAPLKKLLAEMREKLNLKLFHLGSSKLLSFPPIISGRGRPKGWTFRYVAPPGEGIPAKLGLQYEIMTAARTLGQYVTKQDEDMEIAPDITILLYMASRVKFEGVYFSLAASPWGPS
jgi:hypothetical protein